jgi:hypothetical protein
LDVAGNVLLRHRIRPAGQRGHGHRAAAMWRGMGRSPSKAVLSDLSLPGRLPSLIQPERGMSKLTLEG